MAAKTEKTVNYTPEQTAELVAGFRAVANESRETRDAVVKAFAEKFGKTTRSIVAKLSREKEYIKKEYETKTGEKPVKKDETADAIGAVLKLSENEIESLTKANKTALVKIFAVLANSKPITPDDLTANEMASLSRVNKATRAKVFAALESGEFDTPDAE